MQDLDVHNWQPVEGLPLLDSLNKIYPEYAEIGVDRLHLIAASAKDPDCTKHAYFVCLAASHGVVFEMTRGSLYLAMPWPGSDTVKVLTVGLVPIKETNDILQGFRDALKAQGSLAA